MLRLPSENRISQAEYPTMLFRMDQDPAQLHPVNDPEQEARMLALMARLMRENDCPPEQFQRMGIEIS